ncbi:MAG: hypothetical protein COB04_08995, partial [Gammaproteobacteria bacterium]
MNTRSTESKQISWVFKLKNIVGVKAYTPFQLGVFLAGFCFLSDSIAGPSGEEVVGGAAIITRPTLADTLITETGEFVPGSTLIIDWESFNVGAGEQVTFDQLSSDSFALNRVTDGNLSTIAGRITSNGNIFLINPAGLLFAEGSIINVGGIIASGIQLDSMSFDDLEHTFGFRDGVIQGSVINRGGITAEGDGASFVGLIGSAVRNTGSITANVVSLNAGSDLFVTIDAGGFFGVEVMQGISSLPDDFAAAVENSAGASIVADSVNLSTLVIDDAFTQAVNNSGTIQATGIVTDGNSIRLVGTGGGVVNNGSLILGDASTTEGTAFSVGIVGDEVVLGESSNIAISNSVAVQRTVDINIDAVSDINVLSGGVLQSNGGTIEINTNNLNNASTIDSRTSGVDGGDINISVGLGNAGSTNTLGSLVSGDGAISVTGGNGDDSFQLGTLAIGESILVDGGLGVDSITGSDGADNFRLGTIVTTGDDVVINAIEFVSGGEGLDSLIGSVENDTFTLGSAALTADDLVISDIEFVSGGEGLDN